MSNRYTLTLTNTIDNNKQSFQIFGNNDYFDNFHKDLSKFDSTIKQQLKENETFEIEIPSIETLVQAIDQTVWSLITSNNITKRKDRYYEDVPYSEFLDLTSSFLRYDDDGNLKARCPLFYTASNLMETSYITSSFAMYNWLKQNQAVEKPGITKTHHDYTKRDDYVIMSELKPEFKLTLTYS